MCGVKKEQAPVSEECVSLSVYITIGRVQHAREIDAMLGRSEAYVTKLPPQPSRDVEGEL